MSAARRAEPGTDCPRQTAPLESDHPKHDVTHKGGKGTLGAPLSRSALAIDSLSHAAPTRNAVLAIFVDLPGGFIASVTFGLRMKANPWGRSRSFSLIQRSAGSRRDWSRARSATQVPSLAQIPMNSGGRRRVMFVLSVGYEIEPRTFA